MSLKMNVNSMSVRNERDQEVTEGLQIRGRAALGEKAYTNVQLSFKVTPMFVHL